MKEEIFNFKIRTISLLLKIVLKVIIRLNKLLN